MWETRQREREKKKVERGGGERKDEQIAWRVERKEFQFVRFKMQFPWRRRTSFVTQYSSGNNASRKLRIPITKTRQIEEVIRRLFEV